MYHFLQFKPNKKEPWRKYTLEQLKDPSTLPGPPAFQTVLVVDVDPEEAAENELDPLDAVKYFGPFYLDFDDAEDLDHVLDDVRKVLDHLIEKLDIPEAMLNCWLSGGKGVHITIPPQVFGVKAATKFLPMIYREIMLSIEEGAGLKKPDSTVDHNVYSMGRGRMWRCEGVARPGTGTFKVGTTVNELRGMTAEDYELIVASPRPPLALAQADNLSFPKATKLMQAARIAATKKVKALQTSVVVPRDRLREWEGIPGCIQTLITEGDGEGSNWNQAAIQLATYIAARYDRSEEAEYMEDLVKPFSENVENASRATATERVKHVKGQLQRAYAGTLRFSPGAIIACIGRPCRNCPICRSDMAGGETPQEEEDGLLHYDEEMKIKWDSRGYHLIGENGSRQLTSFTFWPHTEVFSLEMRQLADGSSSWGRGPREEVLGYLIDAEGNRYGTPESPLVVREKTWGSKRDLISTFKGHGEAMVYCGDADVQRVLRSIMNFGRSAAENKELNVMVRANVCGIILDRQNGKIIPHYIEKTGSITGTGTRSQYQYSGESASPHVLELPNPYEDDQDLEIAITALCGINDPVQVALAMGWFVACHFRQHIQFDEPQFPLLNISGNSEAGKTSMAMLLGLLNGLDYSKADFQNVEVGTMYPLVQYLCSSTTVPRLVEEVNPALLGTMYNKVVGVLKASWNMAPVHRGRIMDKELVTSKERVSSPVVYTSEQSATIPSVRNRSVEVKLQSRSLLNPEYKRNYQTAISKKPALMRMAKALVTVAMGTSPRQLLEIFHSKDRLIHPDITSRPRWGHMTCLTGLHMLMVAMDEFQIGGKQSVMHLYEELVKYLGGNVVTAERGRAVSEVDRVLATLNILADETIEDPNKKLKPGVHYWRQGDSLYLVLQSCMPKYMSYVRSVGEIPVIREFQQMTQLLEGEVHFLRKEQHAQRNCDVYVLSIEALSKKGTVMNNFVECDGEQ